MATSTPDMKVEFPRGELQPTQGPLTRATSHTRLRARAVTLHFKHSHWWEKAGPLQGRPTLERPTEYVCECKMNTTFPLFSYDHHKCMFVGS